MPSSIARHMSTVSLVSQTSVHLEAGFLVQALNRHKESLESGCDRILASKCSFAEKGDQTVSPTESHEGGQSDHTGSARHLDPKAREALGQHLIEILATIMLPDPPQSIGEVDLKLTEGLPSIPEKMLPSETDAKRFRSLAIRRKKGMLHLPIKEVHMAFKGFCERFNFTVTLYILAVAEHILANFLQTAICYEEKALTERVIRASTIDTLFQIYRERIRNKRRTMEPKLANRFPQDYDKCVAELGDFIRATVDQLNLLLRIFREPVLKYYRETESCDDSTQALFGSLLELYNNMRIFADAFNVEDEEELYQPSARSYLVQSSTTTVSHPPVTALNNTTRERNPIQDAHVFNADRQRRLVGVCLIELAEDDSLHTFSHYSSCVLDALTLDCTWAMLENSTLMRILCHLSRDILHTASLSKVPIFNVFLGYPTLFIDIHSFVCKRCQFWDSDPPRRRRSTSSTPSHHSAERDPTMPSVVDAQSKTLPKHQRSSNSACSIDESMGSVKCNYLVNCFKYLLPRLLLIPIFQFFYLHELIKTLHHCAYDEDDRARLKEVLSMLSKTRSHIERDLAKHPWLFVHLARLLTTGYLTGQYRALYLDLLSTSPTPPSPTAYASLSSPAASPKGNGPNSCTNSPGAAESHKANSFGFPPSLTDVSPSSNVPCHKLDEIERMMGSKGKLAAVISSVPNVGDFVMESRIQLSTENKRSFSEHVAYLFSGLLLIFKWQERRSALNPSLGTNMVLRLKHHIPLEAFHVSDLAPIAQPNLLAYLGNSGSVASSVVGAAVQAASASPSASTEPSTDETLTHPMGSMAGSMGSQSTLTITSGSSYPFMFELEYVDYSSSTVASGHRANCAHGSPQKNPTRMAEVDLALSPEKPALVDSSANCSCVSDGSHRVIIAVRSPEEKADWMASMLAIQLHRLFLRYIRTLPKIEVPLRLPSPSTYRFCQPDSPENIVFDFKNAIGIRESLTELPDSLDSSEEGFSDDVEVSSDSDEFLDDCLSFHSIPTTSKESQSEKPSSEASSAGPKGDISDRDTLTSRTIVSATSAFHKVRHDAAIHVTPNMPQPGWPIAMPSVQMATVDKLIERLTYPAYFDGRLVNTFLLMYRRVLTPSHLLELLIERFRVPDPEFSPEEFSIDTEKGQLESPAQHMLKRFRSGYKKRVQTRVIMFISRWVRTNRYYQADFASNEDLRRSLCEFLNSVQARYLTKSVRRIFNYLQSQDSSSQLNSPTKNPKSVNPNVLYNSEQLTDTNPPASRLDITTIHPSKLAEQVTLYEWELYRSIQFWEVEGRNRVDSASPNLDRSKQFSNRFRNWLVYLILSEPHPADRIVVLQRVIDLMLIMERMNNLQGCQEAKSALISAAVYRLRKSFNIIRRSRHYRDIVDRLRKENTVGSKVRHKSSSKSTHPSSEFGLPVSGSRSKSFDRVSSWSPYSENTAGANPLTASLTKSHERRFKALARQHAAGVSCRPCVPFIAAGVMTRLIHLDLRYPDTITNESGNVLVNCWKFSQMADVLERYLAFQRIPYVFTVDPNIRAFLESLDPFGLARVASESEFESRMYALSESYEPRESDGNVDLGSGLTSNVERRLSKEAIQAAALLSGLPLKERMSFQTMFSFANMLAAPNPMASGSSSRIFTPVQSAFSNNNNSSKSFHSLSPSPRGDSHTSGSPQSARRHLHSPVVCGAMTDSTYFHQHSASDSRVISSKRRTSSTSIRLVHPCPPANEFFASHSHSHSHPPIHPSSQSSANSSLCLPPPLPPRMSGSSSARLSPSPSSSLRCSSSCLPASRCFTPDMLDPDTLPPPLPPKRSPRPATSQGEKHHNDSTFTFDTEPPSDDPTPPPVPPRRPPKAMPELLPLSDSVQSPVLPT